MVLTEIKFSKHHPLKIDVDELKLPRKVESVYAVGKRFILLLEKGIRIVISLRMTGKFLLKEAKHTRAIFDFSRTENKCESKEPIMDLSIFYDDVRAFSTADVFTTDAAFETWRRKNLGWDPLSTDQLTFAQWRKIFAASGAMVAALLVVQKKICGIGNYLRAEILYAAGVSPTRKANSLDTEELRALFIVTKKIMRESFLEGGHTLHSFCDPLGRRGKFKPKVYFPRFSTKVENLTRDEYRAPVERIKIGTQNVYWCPSRQA